MPYRQILDDQPYLLRIKGSHASFTGMSGRALQDLLRLLAEHGELDRDYYVDRTTLAYLHAQAVDPELLSRISDEIGTREGIDIEWILRGA